MASLTLIVHVIVPLRDRNGQIGSIEFDVREWGFLDVKEWRQDPHADRYLNAAMADSIPGHPNRPKGNSS